MLWSILRMSAWRRHRAGAVIVQDHPHTGGPEDLGGAERRVRMIRQQSLGNLYIQPIATDSGRIQSFHGGSQLVLAQLRVGQVDRRGHLGPRRQQSL
jgi:hypothetical protein